MAFFPILRRWLTLGILLAVATVFWKARSIEKPIWLDEGFGAQVVCAPSFMDLVSKGAVGQCSPQPLYYLAQKIWVGSLIPKHPGGFDFLIRGLSLLSLLLTLAVLFALLFREWGALPASLAGGSLLLSSSIIDYAAEDRPYLLWICLLTCHAYFFVRIWRRINRKSLMGFAISSLLLSLSAGAGVVQAGASIFVLLSKDLFIQKRIQWSIVGIGAICLFVSGYYAQFADGCLRSGRWNFFETLDPTLLVGAVRLLIPKGMSAWAGHLIMGFAMFSFLREFVKKWKNEDSAIPNWVMAQVLASLLLAIGIIIKGYYFIPRAFIYYSLLRAIFIGYGAYLLNARLAQRFSSWPLVEPRLALVVPLLIFLGPQKSLDLRTRSDSRLGSLLCSGGGNSVRFGVTTQDKSFEGPINSARLIATTWKTVKNSCGPLRNQIMTAIKDDDTNWEIAPPKEDVVPLKICGVEWSVE